MYRHKSGALVFGAGTLQWSWGLDAHHDTETGVPPERQNGSDTRVGVDPHGPDRVLQQATVNLFADMGVQPATLEEGWWRRRLRGTTRRRCRRSTRFRLCYAGMTSPPT